MKDQIIIRSKGEIETDAFLLLGNSTKREQDGKIGRFGSGLKYAVAKLLEMNVDFQVFSGTDEIKFHTEPVNFRNETFNVIFVNGEKTNFTTEMGPDWKAFDCLREIYTNAIDEELMEFKQSQNSEPIEGETLFIIHENEEFKKVMRKKELYFSHFRDDEKYHFDFRNDYLKIFPSNGEGTRIYKAGFLVYENAEKPALFHYDFSQASINESRQLKSISSTSDSITTVFAKYASREFLREFFEHHRKDRFEHERFESDWDWWTFTNFNDSWKGLFDDQRIVTKGSHHFYNDHLSKLGDYYVLPDRLALKMKKKNKARLYGGKLSDKTNEYITLETIPDEWRNKILKEVLFFENANNPIPYDIEVASFKESNVAGTINLDSQKIILSKRLFDENEEFSTTIRETIYEEYAHLESKKADRTDGFQNYLMSQIFKYMNLYVQQKSKV